MSFADLIEEKHGYIAEAYKQVYGEEQFEKIFVKSKKDLILFIVADKGFYKVLSDKELNEKNGRKDKLINMITANEFFSKEEERPHYMYTFHHSFFIITPNKPSSKEVEITGLGPKKNGYIITKLAIQRDVNRIETVTVKDSLECKVIAQKDFEKLDKEAEDKINDAAERAKANKNVITMEEAFTYVYKD